LIDRTRCASATGVRRGAYVLAEAEATGTMASGSGGGSDRVIPRLILLATGSEVSLALEARDTLQKEGIPTRVVSMPCWELFEEQPEDYRKEVLPPSIGARLAVEAGICQGWDRYVGPTGDVICLDRFGASALERWRYVS